VIYAVLYVGVQRRWEKREIRQNFGGENSCRAFTGKVSKIMGVIKYTGSGRRGGFTEMTIFSFP